MKKTRYTEEQIAFALKQAETGTHVKEVCRNMGISDATFYNWKKKFAYLGVTELRLLRQREDQYQRLKKLVADHILTDLIRLLNFQSFYCCFTSIFTLYNNCVVYPSKPAWA